MRDVVFEEGLLNEKLSEYKSIMTEPMEKHLRRFFNQDAEKYHETRSDMRAFAAFRKEYIETMLEKNNF